MNILQTKKYYLLIKVEWQIKPNLLILHQKKLSEKQIKIIQDRGRQQILKVLKLTEQNIAIKGAISDNQLNEEAEKETENIEKWEKQ